MKLTSLTITVYAMAAAKGVLTMQWKRGSILLRRDAPLLGDVCRSLRHECNLEQLASDAEKLCFDSCETAIDDKVLHESLCKSFKSYVSTLGKCADGPLTTIGQQCGDQCGCLSDADCGKNQTCVDHICVPKLIPMPLPKPQCQHNRECNGQVCSSNNTCVACTTTSDCGQEDLECAKGLCVPNITPPPECTRNTDCKSNQICKDEKCGPCSTSADCSVNQVCSTGECVPEPPTCGQPGFEWAQWRGPPTWSTVKSPPFIEFDPVAFQALKPEHEGLTNSLLISNRQELYGQPIATNLAAVIHQGFLLAPETGNYTFVFGQADDIAIAWLGQNAYSGWTRANADTVRTYIPPPGDETQTTRHLEQGTYYPLRVAWGDKGGSVAMSVKIMAPNGTELTGRDGGYFRTEACDGSYGKFPAYGTP